MHPKESREMKAEKSRKRCTCGFKIRGKNHEEGKHHKGGSDGRYSVKKI